MRYFLAISAVATGLLSFGSVAQAGAASLSDSWIAHGNPRAHVEGAEAQSGCAGVDDADAPAGVQEQAMLCLTNAARHDRGLSELTDLDILDRSAGFKSNDILRCDNFSHEACGHEFTFWMQRVGYLPRPCWRAAENLAWGIGAYGTVRSIFSAWMRSPGHRENILGPYGQIGIGLEVGALRGRQKTHVWTQQFGSRC